LGGGCTGGPLLDCDDGNVCTDDSCVPASGCTYVDNTDPCNDGNACTTNDTCSGGACAGGPAPDCDDANVCTDDSCDPATGCAYLNNNDPCSDDDVCTTNDICSGGGCVGGAPLDCDDDNVCTDDWCDPVSGCAGNDNQEIHCDDGDACTTDDTCVEGVCVGGPALDCNDGNVCTDDTCDPASGCQYVNNNDACSDGDACTTNDMCSGGACVGGPDLDCDDGNVCTDDSCVPATGCTYVNNTAPCNDGDACTTVDTCSAGGCVGGPALECDDGNVCTDDSCDPASGCTYVNNTAPCSDGDVCTTDDTCSGGACVSGPPLVCNDGNVCTDDSCHPATGCTYVNNAAPCDDSDACTTNDTCADGACVGGAPVDCDDGDVCTDDSCVPATGCAYVNNTDPCNDGDPCTANDACRDGACAGGGPVSCPDNSDPCTDLACDPTGDDGNCDATVNVNEGGPCENGDPCSVGETCAGGTCTGGTPVDCSHLDNECNVGVCNAATGECETQAANEGGTCPDDGDECTSDICVNGTCEHNDNGMCEACCMPDTSCVEMTSDTCLAEGGTPAGLRAICGTDSDGDGVDDLCDRCPGVDDATFCGQPGIAIPTVSQWGLVVLTLLLLVASKVYFGRGGYRSVSSAS
jgi:hypothetical protein